FISLRSSEQRVPSGIRRPDSRENRLNSNPYPAESILPVRIAFAVPYPSARAQPASDMYRQQPQAGRFGSPRQRNIGGGIVIGLRLAGFSICKYYSSSQFNEITGETQHASITAEQEIALGLQSLPVLIEQYGGLHPDEEAQRFVKAVGQ